VYMTSLMYNFLYLFWFLCCNRWGVALLKAFDEVEKRIPEVKCPFLVLHGDKDGLCYVEGSRILYEKSSSQDKEIKVYNYLSCFNWFYTVKAVALIFIDFVDLI